MSSFHDMKVSVDREPALVAGVFPSNLPGEQDRIEEICSLADTAGAVILDVMIQHLDKPNTGSFMGKGKLEELALLVKAHKAQAIIFANDLTPSQIRNIEEVVECKVLDRSELILDIFASRARTHEAKLQVELAQLEYTYPRLRAMWSHLERIAGGAPAGIGTRGPGEQQLEIDRRIVQRKKSELRKEIKEVQKRKQREVAQRNVDYFTVGIVGYTNAGKSTLFNTLTDASVYADDKLFATLDTRTRKWELGNGDEVMLSDTVGFVRDLPHHLVASFKATLEEAVHSDLLLIVHDIADANAEHHLDVVNSVLDDIGAEQQPRILLLNKIDALEDNAELLVWQQKYPEAIPISARQGVGLDKLVELVREYQRGMDMEMRLRLPIREGKAISTLENRAEVHEREYGTDTVTFRITVGKRLLDQIKASGAQIEILDGDEGE